MRPSLTLALHWAPGLLPDLRLWRRLGFLRPMRPGVPRVNGEIQLGGGSGKNHVYI